jgi:serine/threonine-protein kinase HipA
MAVRQCLYCYKPLTGAERDFHAACSRRFFGTSEPPELPYALDEMHELANQVVRSSVSVTGVQAKLSMDLQTYKETRKKSRFTIVAMWGNFVLKPPAEDYASLPENEDLTMHLAELFRIRTVPHSLIRLKSGELAYITRRVDRPNGKKLAMEDMCQLTERLTEDKYKGSMEQIGKVIKRFSENRGFDRLEFFQVALFSFLVGNADMHLKNFSLLRTAEGLISLAPAYDLVATRIVLPKDQEETALTINGKKRNLQPNDFHSLSNALEVSERVLDNTLDSFSRAIPSAVAFVQESFLSTQQREAFTVLLEERSKRLGLDVKAVS